MDYFKIRGVVEGFYGKEWSMEEREKIINYMGRVNMNLYVYAPKHDKFHREFWRENYSDSFIREFSKLVENGRSNRVEVSIAVSPGLSLVHASNDELKKLMNKYLQFYKIGVRTFGLFLDDIPPMLQHEEDKEKYKNFPEAQADFTNRVYDALRDMDGNARLILCPTQYWGDGASEYLKMLGNSVNKDVMIMWTGPKVCSEKIPLEDAETVSGTLQRPVLYWDNYPVNDGSMMSELHVGPYTGRDRELYKYSCGILSNPMNQAETSMFVLDYIAKYLNSPEDYDSDKAWNESIKLFFKNVSSQFKEFALSNMKSPLHHGETEKSTEIVEKCNEIYLSGKYKEAIEYLYCEGEKIRKIKEELEKGLDKKFVSEIKPWLDEYDFYGNLLMETANVAAGTLKMHVEKPSSKDISELGKFLGMLENNYSKISKQRTAIFGPSLREFIFGKLLLARTLLSYKRMECNE